MLRPLSCVSTLNCLHAVWWGLRIGYLLSRKWRSCRLAILAQALALRQLWSLPRNSPDLVAAVVSRGGCPDLAGKALRRVVAPTLLIVGGEDLRVLELNWIALAELRGPKKLEIIPGTTHLFEEKGALESVAQFAKNWFLLYLFRANQRARTA